MGVTIIVEAESTEPAEAESAEPISLMGADAARLMGARAARTVSSLFMCPIAPDEADAAPSRIASFSEGYRVLLPLGELLQLFAEHP